MTFCGGSTFCILTSAINTPAVIVHYALQNVAGFGFHLGSFGRQHFFKWRLTDDFAIELSAASFTVV